MTRLLLVAQLALLCIAIAAPQSVAETGYKSTNVIVAVMDGVRYSETFGDPNRALIPNLAALARDGTLFTNYRITGPGISVTRQGHSTISTGTWQAVANGGARMTMPTFFEYARNELGWKESDCLAVFGKGLYSYARYSSFPTYSEKYKPAFVINVGENKMEDDDAVLARVFEALDNDKPKLIFINFGVTDHIGHVGTFEEFQAAIRHCDEMFGKLWEKVQSTPGYKDTTTVLYTNDHGRHNDKPNQPHGGFAGHGDQCEGCRHIMLLALGPDTKRGAVVDREVQEIDICPTVGELLGFQTPLSEGSVIADCLASPLGLNKKMATTPEAREGERLMRLSRRDLVKTVADANLSRDPQTIDAPMAVSFLMRGMLMASDVTGDARYRQYVLSWLDKHADQVGKQPYVARIALEVAARDNDQAAYLDKAKAYATKSAQADSPGDAEAAMARVSLLAKAAEVFGDQTLKDATLMALNLAGKSENELIQGWRASNVRMTPMACDVPKPAESSATMMDTLALCSFTDAAAAMPEDRLARLGCDLMVSRCSQGRPEIGANWKDPVQSATALAAVIQADGLKPKMKYVEPKPDAKGKPTLPRWATPMEFYKDTIRWQTVALSYEVDEKGHFAKGDAMSDGAALMLFCAARARGIKTSPLQTQSN